MFIKEDIKYIGVNDHKIDLFESQFQVPNGMAYNSYLILDEKSCVMDSVDSDFHEEWFAQIDENLQGADPDYIIIQHMEPDHSGSIDMFMKKYPKTQIVATKKAFEFMEQFYGENYDGRRIIVGDNDELSLGKRTLKFITAPMVHWPEVIFTYDKHDKLLFSADAFGKFGALDVDEPWRGEARRYYTAIVGKYGPQVKAAFKKLEGLEIEIICPLHGPVLMEDVEYNINLYHTWSCYEVETKGVGIFYTSVYGNTREAVNILQEKLEEKGCERIVVKDLARSPMSECVEEAFRFGKIVLATTTYNSDIFPYMREFIENLVERGWQNRTIGLIENGTWANMAGKKMMERLSKCKNIIYTDTMVSIKSSVGDFNKIQLENLANELIKE